MKLAARVRGLDGLAARLSARALAPAVTAALDGADATLAAAMAREAGAPASSQVMPEGRLLAVTDPAAVIRETGTSAVPPAPWLAAALSSLASRRRR